jgi:Haem-binding domain
MKKIIKWAVIVLLVAFAGIQFIRPEYSNPAINQPDTLEATTPVPENVEQIFTRSCNDCHTNKTTYPWYSNVAPLSWQIVDHVKDGRRHLNFSVWNTYNTDKKRKKLDEVCSEVTDAAMPIGQYLWLHGNAVLSQEDVKTICDWTQQERERLLSQQGN